MDIAALTSGTGSVADAAKTKFVDDFESFLVLLTTQLKHQDPLSPMDTNEFTAQLVRFTQVEQSIAQNKNLEKLTSLIETGQAAAAVNYIGHHVEAVGSKTSLTEDGAIWKYVVPPETVQSNILVRSSSGQIVYSGPGSTTAGKQTFEWDGKSTNGTPQPEGVYTITVSTQNKSGGSENAPTAVVGVVTGVESTADGGYMLSLGKTKVPFDSVIAVSQG